MHRSINLFHVPTVQPTSPKTCPGAVLLICISGAVILHFITRYLYLRAHRQLLSETRQQAAAEAASNSGSPGYWHAAPEQCGDAQHEASRDCGPA